jgi:heptosyltransferase-1
VRIAIVRLSALGDIVNSLFILSFIKKAYPDALIDWVSEEAFAPLIGHHPDIHRVITVAIKRAKRERSFTVLTETIKTLRNLDYYDHIIDLQGLMKSATVARLIGKNVHGFDKESLREGFAARFYATHSHIPYRENAMLRTAKIVSDALSLNIDRDALLHKVPAFDPVVLPEHLRFLFTEADTIVITMGSSWPAKVYPKEQMFEVIQALKKPTVLVWGSPQEQSDATFIARQYAQATVAPKLTLVELMQVINEAALVIGNDSGPTHMAWMQNRPSITLFGPTPAYKMMFETAINIAIESYSTVDPLKLDRHDFSIKTIPPASVAEKAKELLLR